MQISAKSFFFNFKEDGNHINLPLSTLEFFNQPYFKQYQQMSNEVEVVLDLRKVKSDLASTSTNIWKDGQATD